MSLFRPVVVAGFAVAADAAGVVAGGSFVPGFVLKFALILLRLNRGSRFVYPRLKELIARGAFLFVLIFRRGNARNR